MMGPFYDPSKEPKSSSSRTRTRDWEQEDYRGKGPPDRVGRQGRMKSMAALEQKSRQAEDDNDDWFGNNLSKSARGPPRHPPRETKRISFGKSFSDERQYASPANQPPSLLTRLGGGDNYRERHSNPRSHDTNRHDEGRRSRKSRNKSDNRHQREERREERPGSSAYADGRRQDIPTGPRYRGGYTR